MKNILILFLLTTIANASNLEALSKEFYPSIKEGVIEQNNTIIIATKISINDARGRQTATKRAKLLLFKYLKKNDENLKSVEIAGFNSGYHENGYMFSAVNKTNIKNIYTIDENNKNSNDLNDIKDALKEQAMELEKENTKESLLQAKDIYQMQLFDMEGYNRVSKKIMQLKTKQNGD